MRRTRLAARQDLLLHRLVSRREGRDVWGDRREQAGYNWCSRTEVPPTGALKVRITCNQALQHFLQCWQSCCLNCFEAST